MCVKVCASPCVRRACMSECTGGRIGAAGEGQGGFSADAARNKTTSCICAESGRVFQMLVEISMLTHRCNDAPLDNPGVTREAVARINDLLG